MANQVAASVDDCNHAILLNLALLDRHERP